MYKKIVYSQKGYTLAFVCFMFLGISIISYALVLHQGKQVVSSLNKDFFDKAIHLADSGVEIAKGYLRRDPGLERKPQDNITAHPEDPLRRPVDPLFGGKGKIIFTISQNAVTNTALVVSSGIYTHNGREYKRVVEAEMKIESPGNFFIACATRLTIASNSDLSVGQGILYGNELRFRSGGGITIYKGQYHSNLFPSDPLAAGVTVLGEPIEKVQKKLFPVISNDLMKWYYDIANGGGGGAFLSSPYNDTLEDPANGSNIWYYPNQDPREDSSEGDLVINNFLEYKIAFSSGCLVVVNGNLIINGDIFPEDSFGDYSIGFIVKKNVFISTQDKNTTTARRLEGVIFVVSNGTLKQQIVGGPTQKELKFSGAMIIKTRASLSQGFKATRTYEYDWKVKRIDNLPFFVTELSYRMRKK